MNNKEAAAILLSGRKTKAEYMGAADEALAKYLARRVANKLTIGEDFGYIPYVPLDEIVIDPYIPLGIESIKNRIEE